MKILDKLGLNDQQPTPRKIALLVGVVVLFILVLWFFSRSWVIINVENSSGEVIISVEKDGEETNRINGSFAFLPLNSGEYTISAKDKSGSTAKYAKLRSGQFRSFKLPISKNSTLEMVAPFKASTLVADESLLRFVDEESTAVLMNLSSDKLDFGLEGIHINSMNWVDINNGSGIATMPDDIELTPVLVTVKDGVFTAKRTTVSQGGLVDQAVSSKNNLWFASRASIYNQKEGKLFDASSRDMKLLAANDDFVLFIESINSDFDTTTYKYKTVSSNKVDVGGPEFTYHPNPDERIFAAISPNSKRLALYTGGDITITDRDLKKTDNLPFRFESSTVAWLDDDTLVYSNKNTLWKYNLSTKVATSIASLPNDSSVTDIFLDKSTNQLYLSVRGGSDIVDSIQRVSLDNKEPAKTPDVLSYLPLEFSSINCKVTYINLNKPTIVIDRRGSSAASFDDCKTSLIEELSKYNVSLPANIPLQDFHRDGLYYFGTSNVSSD